jgi:hypothetical protein
MLPKAVRAGIRAMLAYRVQAAAFRAEK